MPPIAKGLRITSGKVTGAGVVGLADAINALEAIGHTVGVSAMRKALYAGAVVFRDQARRNVPVRTGALKKSIVADTKRRSRGGDKKNGSYYVGRVTIKRNSYGIGAKGKLKRDTKHKGVKGRFSVKGQIYPRNYAHLVEFGVGAHSIAKGAKSHAVPIDAVLSDARPHKMHPGARAKPFMRPAFDTKRAEAVEAATRVLKVEVLKAAAKGRKPKRGAA